MSDSDWYTYCWARVVPIPEGQEPEKVIVVDVTGRRHTALVRDAKGTYQMFVRGGGSSDNWLKTETGAVRQGALAHVVKP